MDRLADKRATNVQAILRSPLFTPSDEATCLQMDVFKGPIQVTGNQLGKTVVLFNTSAAIAESWISLNLTVPRMVNRIEICTRSNGVAIDNILLEQSPCQGMFFLLLSNPLPYNHMSV